MDIVHRTLASPPVSLVSDRCMASYSGGRSVTLGLSDVLTRLESGRDRCRNRGTVTNNTEVTTGTQPGVEDVERRLGQKLDRLIALCIL